MLLWYKYIFSRAIFFLAIYGVIYGYDSMGIISAFPLIIMMGVYYFTMLLMVIAGTIWTKFMRVSIVQRSEEIKKDPPYAWLFFGVGDLVFSFTALKIFAFNGFDSFAYQMMYLFVVVIINMLAVARIRFIIWQELGKN